MMKTKNLLRSLAGAGVAVLALTGLGAPSAQAFPVDPCSDYADCGQLGGHISRATVINRAMIWVNQGQFYSQDVAYAYNGTGQNGQQKWRRDCSGFVSMAWRLNGQAPNYGRNTSSLIDIAPEISYPDLMRGDILDDPNGGPGYSAHVIIFDGWVGAVGGDFFMIEENPSYGGAVRHKASAVSYLQAGGIKGRADAGDNFVPRRYNKITNS